MKIRRRFDESAEAGGVFGHEADESPLILDALPIIQGPNLNQILSGVIRERHAVGAFGPGA